MNIVFMHVGHDTRPLYLVRSIRKFIPGAKIYQCSDFKTEKIFGVDFIFRKEGDTTNLMTFRLEIFSELNLEEPAIYIDTDMLVNKNFSLIEFENYDAVLCRRSYGKDIKMKYPGMSLPEYAGMTLDEVYPFLACFTYSKSFKFWTECSNILRSLDSKFHYWFGDQEALRIISQKSIFNISYVNESIFGCLPEFVDEKNPPNILHFKGLNRKNLMLEVSTKLFNC